MSQQALDELLGGGDLKLTSAITAPGSPGVDSVTTTTNLKGTKTVIQNSAETNVANKAASDELNEMINSQAMPEHLAMQQAQPQITPQENTEIDAEVARLADLERQIIESMEKGTPYDYYSQFTSDDPGFKETVDKVYGIVPQNILTEEEFQGQMTEMQGGAQPVLEAEPEIGVVDKISNWFGSRNSALGEHYDKTAKSAFDIRSGARDIGGAQQKLEDNRAELNTLAESGEYGSRRYKALEHLIDLGEQKVLDIGYKKDYQTDIEVGDTQDEIDKIEEEMLSIKDNTYLSDEARAKALKINTDKRDGVVQDLSELIGVPVEDLGKKLVIVSPDAQPILDSATTPNEQANAKVTVDEVIANDPSTAKKAGDVINEFLKDAEDEDTPPPTPGFFANLIDKLSEFLTDEDTLAAFATYGLGMIAGVQSPNAFKLALSGYEGKKGAEATAKGKQSALTEKRSYDESQATLKYERELEKEEVKATAKANQAGSAVSSTVIATQYIPSVGVKKIRLSKDGTKNMYYKENDDGSSSYVEVPNGSFTFASRDEIEDAAKISPWKIAHETDSYGKIRIDNTALNTQILQSAYHDIVPILGSEVSDLTNERVQGLVNKIAGKYADDYKVNKKAEKYTGLHNQSSARRRQLLNEALAETLDLDQISNNKAWATYGLGDGEADKAKALLKQWLTDRKGEQQPTREEVAAKMLEFSNDQVGKRTHQKG